MTRNRVLAVLLVALVLLSACSGDSTNGEVTETTQGEDSREIPVVLVGLRRAPTGAVELISPDCDGLELDGLTVTFRSPTGGVTGEPLWAIYAEGEPTDARVVVLGQAPTGFVESVALAGALPEDQVLATVGNYRTTQDGESVVWLSYSTFTISDLPEGDSVLVVHGEEAHGVVTEAEFQERAVAGDCTSWPEDVEDSTVGSTLPAGGASIQESTTSTQEPATTSSSSSTSTTSTSSSTSSTTLSN